MIRVAGFAIAAAFAAAAVRQMRPGSGNGDRIGGGRDAAGSSVEPSVGACTGVGQPGRQAQLKTAYVRTILKVMGICFPDRLSSFGVSGCAGGWLGGARGNCRTCAGDDFGGSGMLMSLLEQLLELTA